MHTKSSEAYSQQSTARLSAHSSSTWRRRLGLISGLVAAMLTAIAGAAATDEQKSPSQQGALPAPTAKLMSPRATEWPFTSWSYAKAYTFNFFPARHGVQLRILENGNWSQHVDTEVIIDREHAQRVIGLVNSTKGSFETSKCPFPRHAFVFFDDKDEPIGSVDVCFECDDLFAWPDFKVSDDAKYGTHDEIEIDDPEDDLAPVGPRGGLWTEFRSALAEYKKILQEVGLPLNWQ